MPASKAIPPPTERLRAAPQFSLSHTLDGRPFVAGETEPYVQYWITERDRVVLSMFSGRHGATLGEAIDGALRLLRPADKAAERRRLLAAAAAMRAAGVLVATRDDSSRYDARIVDAYLSQRPFPRAIADAIVAAAPVTRESRVLDLAGGPGDLALALARVSEHVALMDLSRGFLASARRRAKQAGLALQTLHESCNRLLHHDEALDVVTVSQALHWLDDVQVCRGLCRVLRSGGSFFVVHAAIELEDTHPLAYVLGHDSILGAKRRQSFAAEVEPLWRRLSLLFDALDAPEVARHHLGQRDVGARIGPAGASLFVQPRPIDAGYAHAFLTDRHLEPTGMGPAAFWRDLDARCAAATPAQMQGRMHWALLHFRRGGERAPQGPLATLPVREIPF